MFFFLTVSEGIESTFAGLKKKKKKQVSWKAFKVDGVLCVNITYFNQYLLTFRDKT